MGKLARAWNGLSNIDRQNPAYTLYKSNKI